MKGEPKLQHRRGWGGGRSPTEKRRDVRLSLRPNLRPLITRCEPPLTLFPVLRSLKLPSVSAPPDPKTKPATERGRQAGEEGRGSAVWVEEGSSPPPAPTPNQAVPGLAPLECFLVWKNSKEIDGLAGRKLAGGAVRRGVWRGGRREEGKRQAGKLGFAR